MSIDNVILLWFNGFLPDKLYFNVLKMMMLCEVNSLSFSKSKWSWDLEWGGGLDFSDEWLKIIEICFYSADCNI